MAGSQEWQYVQPQHWDSLKLLPWFEKSKSAVNFERSMEEQWAVFRNSNMEDEIRRIHLAQALLGPDGEKRVEKKEWRQFLLMIQCATLYTENGLLELWCDKPSKLFQAPNFGQFMGQTRFRRIRFYSQFAFADEAEIRKCAVDGTKNLSFDMLKYRYTSVESRVLTCEVPKRFVADEWRTRHIPRTDAKAGCPHVSYDDKKPDPLACEHKDIHDPDQKCDRAHIPVDDPDKMASAAVDAGFGDSHGNAAVTLRLMKRAGATADNEGNFFGDTAFVSMDVIQGVLEHFPGWSVTGPIKSNNCSRIPRDFLLDLSKSRHGDIKRGGTHHIMTTQVGGRTVMLIAHKYNEDSTKLLISTAGDTSMGKYKQSYVDDENVRHDRFVDRLNTVIRYFDVCNVIDITNHLAANERLLDSWPGVGFWVKMFIAFEGRVMVDWYRAASVNPPALQSMQRTGRTETFDQFVKRFCNECLEPVRGSVDASFAVRSTPPQRKRLKLDPDFQVKLNGIHEEGHHLRAPARGRDGHIVGGTVERKACVVCKAQGRRMPSGREFPKTTTYCRACKGFVHGRGIKGYEDCWDDHLITHFDGLYYSGDL